jgi:hypothetical protein
LALFKKEKKRKFKLTYGVPLADHRGGGVSKVMKEGYVVQKLRGAPYKFSVMVMPSAERILPLLESLSRLVGFPCMAVLEDHLNDPHVVYSSANCTMEEALAVYNEFSFRLINDGFTAFGLASEQFEVFVGDHKDLQIFCNSLLGVEETMGEFGIPKRSKLRWVGEGGHYHLQLGALFDDRFKVMNEPLPKEEIAKFEADDESYTDFQNDIINRLGLKVDTWRPDVAEG